MTSPPPIPQKLRFDAYELDLRAAELTKNGLRIRLQEQPFKILVELLRNPGEVVLRDDIKTKLWPDGTSVDFDHSINAAVKRLRDALVDTAENPRYVETVGRRGYRFIGLVSSESLPYEPVLSARDGAQQAEAPLSHLEPAIPPQGRRRRNAIFVAIAAILILLAAGVFLRRSKPGWPSNLRVTPLTANTGLELEPTFSPDGTRIAFAWGMPPEKQMGIYVKLAGPGDPVKISNNVSRVFSPAWSPDGRWVAALQDLGSQGAILLIPAMGGPIRELARVTKAESEDDACAASSFPFLCGVPSFGAALAWSADGKYVLTSAKLAPHSPLALVRISVESGEVLAITRPPLGSDGDFGPAVSPDGQQLAFARFTSMRTGDLYVIPLSANSPLMGATPRRLTTDGADIRTAAWMPNGRTLIFSSDRAGQRQLWQVSAAGGEPIRVDNVGEDAMDVAVSSNGSLIYNRGHYVGSLWKIPITAGKGGDPIQVTATTARDKYAQFSPDGKRIVFQSGRSGVDEIWVCDADGGNAVQLTTFGKGISGSPRWSPDGRTIAFDSNVNGSFDIYTVSSGGGKPLRLTAHASADAIPTWSRDGAWVYFTSWRAGREEVWKVRPTGGSETQITRNGGGLATESVDGKYLYFARGGDLLRMQPDGSHEAKVASSVTGRFLLPFSKGIYFTSGVPKAELRYLEFANGRVRVVSPLPGMPDVDVSSDEHWILYPQPKMSDTNLMVVSDFR